MAVDFLRGKRPQTESTFTRVERIDSPSKRRFVVLSRHAWGTPFHWYGHKSHICTKETHDTCAGCQALWPSKWRAYLHVSEMSANPENFILELTEHALNQAFAQMEGRKDMRGTILSIGKKSASKHSQFVVEVLERVLPSDSLMAEIDPEPILKALWDINAKALQARR